MVEIESSVENEVCTIAVKGEIDASSSIHLDQSISEAISKHKNIIIDCSEIIYISSAGLGVFMSYINELEEKNVGLVLYGLSDKVLHVFQILGLDQLLNIVETETKAKEKLNVL
ncbi:MAG: STAS domain-containing protein [Cyclobacteriaceae bacterium]